MPCTIAFIGLGAIAQKFHLRALSVLVNTDLSTDCTLILCDPDIMNRQKAYQLICSLLPARIHIVCMDQADHVAEKFAVDYVIISSPTFLHYEHCKLFLNSGSNVLCEKPLALITEHASELFDLAQSKNLSLVVGYHQRFRHETKYIKEILLLRGEDIASVRIDQIRFNSTPSYSPWYLNSSLSGGLIFDLASHYFDLVSYLLGSAFPCNVMPRLRICEFSGSSLIRLEGQLHHPDLPLIDFSFSYECDSQASSRNSIMIAGDTFTLAWPSCIRKDTNGISNSLEAEKIVSEANQPKNYASLNQLAYFLRSSGGLTSEQYVAENLSLIKLCLELKNLADLQTKS